jgi:ADP-heptose:LPS heptosyltransferase
LDYFTGIPFCFLLSICERLRQAIKRGGKGDKSVQKILIIKPFELGSIILSFPLIQEIKKTHPQAQIFFLTNDKNSDILTLFNMIPPQSVITFHTNNYVSLIRSLFKCLHHIRRLKIDTCIDLEFFSRFSGIISYLSGAPRRIGFDRFAFEGLYRGHLLTHKVYYNPHVHVSELYFSMAKMITLPGKKVPTSIVLADKQSFSLPKFVPTSSQERRVRSKLHKVNLTEQARLYLFNLGEGILAVREWPFDFFATVIEKLLEDPKNMIVLVGTLNCKEKAQRMSARFQNARVIDFTNETSLEDLLTLITLSEYLICNDSGTAHLGALTETKQIVLFGPEHPRVFGPLGEKIQIMHRPLVCSPCLSPYNFRISHCTNNICLKDISPQEVINTISS